MGLINYSSTSNGGYSVPSAVKCVCYISVGGGGGGAYPNINPPAPRPGFTPPRPGGPTSFSAGGATAYGGGGGNLYSGGGGGYGNLAYGQTGYYNSSGGGSARARSGYGPYGTGGAGQWRSPSQTYGGGGGGASQSTVARGSSGAIPGQWVSWSIGCGGTQGGSGTCRYGQHGAAYVAVCTYDPPTPSITATPTSFRADGSDGSDGTVDLTWSVGGGDSDSEVLERLDINGNVEESYGQVNRNQPSAFVVSPTESSIFRLTASNPAYTRTDNVTVMVYQKPVITFTTNDNDNTIFQGDSITLSWNVTGDANNVVISPGVGNTNLSSSTTVSPTQTTVYSAVATGLGGTGSAEITVTVLPPVSIDVTGPVEVLWGNNIPVNIDAVNADGGIEYAIEYRDLDGTVMASLGSSGNQIPNSTGDLINITGYTIPVTYDETLPAPFGPGNIQLTFTANGEGSQQATKTLLLPVVVDQNPDAISIPESTDVVKDQDPVITPNIDVTSTLIEIQDIDVPVEIKSDYAIKVEIDDGGTYQDVRQI